MSGKTVALDTETTADDCGPNHASDDAFGSGSGLAPTMDKFFDLLEAICARPALYVGRCSLYAVADYLGGYCHGLAACGQSSPPMEAFQRWTEMRFGIRQCAWNWTRILLHSYGDDDRALAALPSLYIEFLEDLKRLGRDEIEAETTRHLLAEHGQDWWEPTETTTQPISLLTRS